MSARRTCIYVIGTKHGAEICGPCKVGISEQPRERLASLQTASPYDLVLVSAIAFPSRAIAAGFERVFMATQSAHRLRGEWYDIAPSLASEIVRFHVTAIAHVFGRSGEAIQS